MQPPLQIEPGPGGRPAVRREGEAVPVSVVRCFPWLAPDRWLSLRDDEGKEVAMVEDLAGLDPASREALAPALALSGFLFEVTGIEEVKPDFELRRWRVRTAQGPRTFFTELDAWPDAAPGGGMLLRDLGGDLYRIPPPERLDPQSRRHLWAFVD